MRFDEFEHLHRFRDAWNAIEIVRSVHYTLFTFGSSELPYFLITGRAGPAPTVAVTRGEVRIARPLIITPDNARPEFLNFFETDDDEQAADFILSREAAFSHLKFENQHGQAEIVTDSTEEAVSRLNRRLDDHDDDRTAIITAPAELAGLAVFRYATERVWRSAPGNVQELRERGFLR